MLPSLVRCDERALGVEIRTPPLDKKSHILALEDKKTQFPTEVWEAVLAKALGPKEKFASWSYVEVLKACQEVENICRVHTGSADMCRKDSLFQSICKELGWDVGDDVRKKTIFTGDGLSLMNLSWKEWFEEVHNSLMWGNIFSFEIDPQSVHKATVPETQSGRVHTTAFREREDGHILHTAQAFAMALRGKYRPDYVLPTFANTLDGDKRMQLTCRDWNMILRAPGELKGDPEIIALAIDLWDLRDDGNPCPLTWATACFRSYNPDKWKQLVLSAVRKLGTALRWIPPDDRLIHDREVVLEATKQSGEALNFIDPDTNTLAKNEKLMKQLMLLAVKTDDRALTYPVATKWHRDYDVMLASVIHNPSSYKVIPSAFLSNRKWVLAAVTGNPLVLHEMPSRWAMDMDVIQIALEKGPRALFERLRAIKRDMTTDVSRLIQQDEMLNAVNNDGRLLEYANLVSWKLLHEQKIVLAAVRTYGAAIQWINPNLRTDKKVVMAAVQQNGQALAYASKLRGDINIVMAAVQQNGQALASASYELRNNHNIVMAAVQQNGHALASASYELKGDIGIVMAAVQQNGIALYHARYELKGDIGIVMAAVQQNGQALAYASYELQNNKDVVEVAIGKDADSFEYASLKLRCDPSLVAKVIETNAASIELAIRYLPKDISIASVVHGNWENR